MVTGMDYLVTYPWGLRDNHAFSNDPGAAWCVKEAGEAVLCNACSAFTAMRSVCANVWDTMF